MAEGGAVRTGRLAELMQGRERLAVLPTPLHLAPRLSARLGTQVWLKRDDLTGVGLGGNKIRKMELIAADARRAGADVLVSVGAAQSNHARTVAAVAAMLGLDALLVLGGERPERPTGNLALDVLFGARVEFAGGSGGGGTDWSGLAEASRRHLERLRAQGRRPNLVPAGGSVALGVAAFTAAYLELREQLGAAGVRPAAILHASSSGGTQAGLELGRLLAGDPAPVLGVDVARMSDPLSGEVSRLVAAGARLLGVDPGPVAPTVLDGYLGDGYAVPSPGSTAALRLLASTEGVVADPVYTAKALHALCAESWDGPVVFWHTGGMPALFAEAHADGWS